MNGKEQKTKMSKDKGGKQSQDLNEASTPATINNTKACIERQKGESTVGHQKLKAAQTLETVKEHVECEIKSKVNEPLFSSSQALTSAGTATQERAKVTQGEDSKTIDICAQDQTKVQIISTTQSSDKSIHSRPSQSKKRTTHKTSKGKMKDKPTDQPPQIVRGGGRLDQRQIEEIARDVCAGKREPSHHHIPTAKDIEKAHEEDLDLLEQAIAQKRMRLAAEQEMEHMKEKQKLQAKIEKLEHSRLAQQHAFRGAYYKMQQKLEALSRQYDKEQQEHCKELERVAIKEKAVTQSVINKISSVRAEREALAPELGRLDGALEIALSPDADTDQARIERGIFLDKTRKLQDTMQNYASDEQQLQMIGMEEMDELMDEIGELEAELSEEREMTEDSRAAHANRLNELKTQIQKANKGPTNFDDEQKNLEENVAELKDYWQSLRGHIEEHLEHSLEVTEKKKNEGRAALLRQRSELFIERHELSDAMKEASAKVNEEQKNIDIAKQFFQERVKVKTKELNDQEDWHSERMRERTDRRVKRIKDLDNKEKERAKRRMLEIQLLAGKQKKMIENFNMKKSHLHDAINEAEQRIKEAEEELHEPTQEDTEKISSLQCGISDIEQKRMFLADEKTLMKIMAKKEIEQIEEEGNGIKSIYLDKLAAKQKELIAMKHAKAKNIKQSEKKIAHLEAKFGKQIEDMNKDNDKLEQFIENLTQEVGALQRQRDVLKEEYATEQNGIRNAIFADQLHVEKEREKVHDELNKDKERHEEAIDEANQKIDDARAYRHDMLQEFRKDAGEFAAKAAALGPSGSGSPEARKTMLSTYQAQIQEYIKRVQVIDEKLKSLIDNYATKTDAKSKEKREALSKLRKQNKELGKELEKKQKLVKEGDRLLQLFINDDHCLYCKERNPAKNNEDQLSWIQRENEKLTDKLADLSKSRNQYENISSKQLEELENTFQRIDNKFRPGSRTPQSSKASSLSINTRYKYT